LIAMVCGVGKRAKIKRGRGLLGKKANHKQVLRYIGEAWTDRTSSMRKNESPGQFARGLKASPQSSRLPNVSDSFRSGNSRQPFQCLQSEYGCERW
jgi:hypothetical protein